MKKRNPGKIDLLFVLDEASKGWAGEKGYVTPELLGKHLPPAGLKDKVKIFVCGPPPMMNSVSGNKESPAKQGALKGILADLGCMFASF